MTSKELKNLIEEVVRKIVKEELKDIYTALLENKKITNHLNKVGDFPIPNYSEINSLKPLIREIQTSGNPLIDLLNETKNSMTGDDWGNIGNFNSENTQTFIGHIHGDEPVVGTVNDMLGNSRGKSDINQIEIDVVPNFTKLMGVMKEQGKI
jgi:hypothetical protein